MDKKTEEIKPIEEKHCGIIMPIAPMDGYSSEHWAEVKSIITEATKQVPRINFKTEIVSNSDGEIDIIHKRIIQNIYNADIVICDISGKNPNVMFELGMRLTFDKPTIIIKDDVTDFIFDTGVIEHLIYPKDLRFKKIVDFKEQLASRIKITYEKAKNDTSYSTFLGSFGQFKIPTLNQESISDVNQLILDEISNLRKEVNTVKREISASNQPTNYRKTQKYNISKEEREIGRFISLTKEYINQNSEPKGIDELVEDKDYILYLLNNNINASLINSTNIKNALNYV